jgi:hypothetical protein
MCPQTNVSAWHESVTMTKELGDHRICGFDKIALTFFVEENHTRGEAVALLCNQAGWMATCSGLVAQPTSKAQCPTLDLRILAACGQLGDAD